MSLFQLMFVTNHISTFLVMWLLVTSVLRDSISLTYCFYHISFKIFSKKWRCPYYCFNNLFGAILMFFRTYEYTISSMTKCCHLNGYDFIKHCLLISFDMFVNINKYLYILYIFACYLFLLPCIYSRTLAHVATVTCWLYPTLNKFYLILSILTYLKHTNAQWTGNAKNYLNIFRIWFAQLQRVCCILRSYKLFDQFTSSLPNLPLHFEVWWFECWLYYCLVLLLGAPFHFHLGQS